jgi:hypothetical protein
VPKYLRASTLATDHIVYPCSTIQNQNGDRLAGKSVPGNVAKYFEKTGSDVVTINLDGQSQSGQYTRNELAMKGTVQCLYALHNNTAEMSKADRALCIRPEGVDMHMLSIEVQ